MKELIKNFKSHVISACNNPDFTHHKWYVKYHLNIIERLIDELVEIYPEVDINILYTMVWLHDYWKIVNFDNQYNETLISWKSKLLEIWFNIDFVDKVIKYIDIMDKKVDIKNEVIEIQIMSSVDWVAHLIWPFFSLWWYENPQKDFDDLMSDNIWKAKKDWDKKVVLPILREKFQDRHNFLMEQCWVFPEKFL